MTGTKEEKLQLLSELIMCVHDLYAWTYSPDLEMTHTNCPEPELMDMLFAILSDTIPKDADRPVWLTSELGISWIVVPERDSEGKLIHYLVIGPSVNTQVSVDNLRKALRKKQDVSYSLVRSVEMLVSGIPMVSQLRMIEYGIMLYYCLTGVKIDGYDVIYPEATAPVSKERSSHTENPTGTWLMEQKLYRLVEDGNLDFRSEMTRLTAGASPADLGSGDAMRHYKNLQIIFASGCARAAIRGGLSPEVSYDLSDKYIMDIEKAGSVAELLKINETMQEDYIMRVYRAKQQGNTPQIRQACDYIQTHIEEKLDLDTVSSAIGYSVSWLSGKFRKETGKTIGHYIAEQKAERAKLLLRADNRPVQDIAEELSFKTASHFSATFRRYTGMTPNEYRKKAGIEKS